MNGEHDKVGNQSPRVSHADVVSTNLGSNDTRAHKAICSPFSHVEHVLALEVSIPRPLLSGNEAQGADLVCGGAVSSAGTTVPFIDVDSHLISSPVTEQKFSSPTSHHFSQSSISSFSS
jgi:hypothetical protein